MSSNRSVVVGIPREVLVMLLAAVLASSLGALALTQDDAAWREIDCPPTRRDASDLWQYVDTIDPLDDAESLSPLAGDQHAFAEMHLTAAGTAAHYRFSGREGLEYVELMVDAPLPQDAPGLGLEYRARDHSLPVRVRVADASGEIFQYTLGTADQGQWQLGVAVLQPRTGHWGGDGNGQLDPPLTLQSIILDRATGEGFEGDGLVWLRRLITCRREDGALTPHGIRVEIPAQRQWLIYEPGEPVTLRATLTEAGDAPRASISAAVIDPFGQVQWEQSLDGAGPAEISWTPEHPGHYDLRLRRAGAEDDLMAPWADVRLAVLGPAGPNADSPLAVCTHFSQRWDQRLLELIPALGIATIRDECSWSSVEREKGLLEIPEHVRSYVGRSAGMGLTPLLITDYANPHYDDGGYPTSPEAIAGFARYAGFLAAELGDAVPFFEVWNEWTGGCGMGDLKGDADAYPPLFLATADAITDARPGAAVVGVGGEYGGSEGLSQAIRMMMGQGAADRMDGFSIHPYQYPRLADAAYRERLVAAANTASDVAGRPVPMWLTEIGWPTQLGDRGSDFLHQSRCLVRMAVMSLTVPTTEKIAWYDLKDDGTDIDYNEHNFGLVHHDQYAWAPKPGFVALASLARLIGRGDVREWSLEDRVWRVSFDGVTVAWAETGEAVLGIPEGGRVLDMFGRPMETNGSLRLDWNPVYILTE